MLFSVPTERTIGVLSAGTEKDRQRNVVAFFAETLTQEFLRERKCTTYYCGLFGETVKEKNIKMFMLILASRTLLVNAFVYTLFFLFP